MMCVNILQAGVYLKASGTRYLHEDSFSNAFVRLYLGVLTAKVALQGL